MLDLARPDDISTALGRLAPDLVVNPAAYTAVDRAEDEPDLAYRINGEAPAAIAAWSAAAGVPLIHFSTDCSTAPGLGNGARTIAPAVIIVAMARS